MAVGSSLHEAFWRIEKDLLFILASDDGPIRKMQAVCDLLRHELDRYDWVGFYKVVPGRRVLELGPYSGDATDHVSIPFGRGICGQVAMSQETIVVPDVGRQDNYLSCSPMVKSEIVVPIFAGGVFVAQLDIDSHSPEAFGTQDAEFLESLCSRMSSLFAARSA